MSCNHRFDAETIASIALIDEWLSGLPSYVSDGVRAVTQTYSLAQIAGVPQGVEMRLGIIAPLRGTELLYERILRSMLNEIATVVREDVIPGYRGRNALVSDRIMRDNVSQWVAALNRIRESLIARIQDRIDTLIDTEARRHTERFRAIVRSQLNVDLAAVVRQEALSGYLEGVALRSAGLIRGLYDDAVRDVARITQEAVLSNMPINDLRKALQERLQISSRRARLIAVNEVGTLTSALTQIRQEQAGIARYEWSDSDDARVRPLHSEYDGQIFSWAKPPADGHPGQAIRCRCVAIGILET